MFTEDEGVRTVVMPGFDLPADYRMGFGFDAHALAEGESLVLGGVPVPSQQGLVGYSDADVLTHAVIDALLGAAGLGDIGRHFPSSDPRYRGISSITLLEHVRGLLDDHGWQLANVDATVVAQAPRLGPYLDEMRDQVALTLGAAPERVNVKAKTTDGLGFLGRGEGMAAYAVALLVREQPPAGSA